MWNLEDNTDVWDSEVERYLIGEEVSKKLQDKGFSCIDNSYWVFDEGVNIWISKESGFANDTYAVYFDGVSELRYSPEELLAGLEEFNIDR